jgi:hypothetical protein
MFNFFKKTNINEEEPKNDKEDVVASISYFVKRNGPVIVDVAVEDYNEDSMNALFSILDILCQDQCYVETVNIIRNSLTKENKDDLLILLINHIGKQMIKESGNKISTYNESLRSQPCIKPSDMLK